MIGITDTANTFYLIVTVREYLLTQINPPEIKMKSEVEISSLLVYTVTLCIPNN